jgi:hypothetical protein
VDSRITSLVDGVVTRRCLSPFLDIDLKVSVEVSHLSHGDETPSNSAIQWVTIPVDPELPKLISNAIKSPEFLNEDIEEIWHADCPVAGTGLVADRKGEVSILINNLRKGLAWPHQLPSLDKVIWSKSSATKVSGFHTDHFPFGSATCRSSGGATRVIANLGVHPRVVAFLLPNSAGQLPLGNEYCPREYKSLAGLLKGATLVFASLPAYSLESGVAGVQFDAHNVLHSGLPYQGAIAAVITNWTKYV